MGSEFRTALRPAIVLLLLFTALLGIAYPFAILGVGQILFPAQANGSLIEENGKVVGSSLIGQAFTSPAYFNTRPSAAGDGYDASASSGSNLGPTSQALVDRTKESVAAAREAGISGPIPADMLTASGSGLDPHLSPAAALAQVERVARTRGFDPSAVRALVERATEKPALGILGEPRVNVLLLNRQLDRMGAETAR